MTNPDWNMQVKIGHGQATSSLPDTGAHHRAIEVARQLLAMGQWSDYLNTLIFIHDAYDPSASLRAGFTPPSATIWNRHVSRRLLCGRISGYS